MKGPYIAFISYSRKDKAVADWLHDKLENYVLPPSEKISSIFPFKTKYFRPVFLDTQDLHVEERPFSEDLKRALEDSYFLIVLCSRHSAVSSFVNKEIKYFAETHDNNMSRIVPLFLDEVDGCIPEAFNGTSIMQRHFPIYNSHLANSSEANNYCFYQIISYILKLDFSEVYNRYEVATRKAVRKRRNIYMIIIAFLLLVTGILSESYYRYRVASNEALERKQRLIEFEKKVFPAAVVHGYEKNFLTPVINYLKDKGESFAIYVLMPKNRRELLHIDRVKDFEYEAKRRLNIDSVPIVFLPTEANGSRVMRIVKDGQYIDGIYIDFATTSTSFFEIAEFKKSNKEYSNTPIDSIICGYANDFVEQSNEQLKSDSTFVKFVFDKQELIDILGKKINESR
jgi:hypothetical protein